MAWKDSRSLLILIITSPGRRSPYNMDLVNVITHNTGGVPSRDLFQDVASLLLQFSRICGPISKDRSYRTPVSFTPARQESRATALVLSCLSVPIKVHLPVLFDPDMCSSNKLS